MVKNVMYVVAGLVGVVVLAAAVSLYRSGYFTKIVITEKEIGPFVLVYEEHVGDYRDTKTIHQKLYYALKNDKIETTRGFGIYYDNPRQVPKEKLRSDVGMILDPRDYDKMEALQKKYKVRRMDKQKAVVVEFPFKSSLSIMAGIFKAYPAIMQYVKDKNYKQREMMEIYDSPGQTIVYIMPL